MLRIERLERDVEFLKKERPGRKPLPILVSEKGVCGLDPSRDSATCQDATIYRWQRGCLGTACEAKNRDYYDEYRKGKGKDSDSTTAAKGRGGTRRKAQEQEQPVTIRRTQAGAKPAAAGRRGAKAQAAG